MSLTPYRTVLAQPGVLRLVAFGVLARVPLTASGVVLTLHVVTTLHLGYAQAGLVATTSTLGMALGSPWRGRSVDRRGLRRAVVPSIIGTAVIWGMAPFVGYGLLLPLSFIGGLLSLPIFTVIRQSMAVLVAPEQLRSAYTLDSTGVELSFVLGPLLGVLAATQLATTTAILIVGGCLTLSGIAVFAFNPPTRTSWPGPNVNARRLKQPSRPGRPRQPGQPSPRRSEWFSPALLAVLAAGAGATVVLAGTDVAIVAHLRSDHALHLTGLVFAAWGFGSVCGGLLYGGARRPISPFVLLLGLGVLTVPVGLAPSAQILLLTILPAALLCAPVITATAEGVSRLVPESVRGEAMGWHGSALQVGSAIGAPLAGSVMDAHGSWAGFAAVGAAGAGLAVIGLVVLRMRQTQQAQQRRKRSWDCPPQWLAQDRQLHDVGIELGA